jgi:hypothetical protein
MITSDKEAATYRRLLEDLLCLRARMAQTARQLERMERDVQALKQEREQEFCCPECGCSL